jgi:hypothetical protein
VTGRNVDPFAAVVRAWLEVDLSKAGASTARAGSRAAKKGQAGEGKGAVPPEDSLPDEADADRQFQLGPRAIGGEDLGRVASDRERKAAAVAE